MSDLLKWETNRPVFTWFSTVLRRNPALTTSYTVTTNRYNVADDVEGKVRGMVDAICAAAVAIARIDLSAPAEQQGRYNGGRRQRNPRKAPAPASTAKRWLPTERKVAHRGALRRRGPRRQASRQGRRRVEEGALRTRLTTFSLGTRPGRCPVPGARCPVPGPGPERKGCQTRSNLTFLDPSAALTMRLTARTAASLVLRQSLRTAPLCLTVRCVGSHLGAALDFLLVAMRLRPPCCESRRLLLMYTSSSMIDVNAAQALSLSDVVGDVNTVVGRGSPLITDGLMVPIIYCKTFAKVSSVAILE